MSDVNSSNTMTTTVLVHDIDTLTDGSQQQPTAPSTQDSGLGGGSQAVPPFIFGDDSNNGNFTFNSGKTDPPSVGFTFGAPSRPPEEQDQSDQGAAAAQQQDEVQPTDGTAGERKKSSRGDPGYMQSHTRT